MITVKITSDAAAAHTYLVEVTGSLKDRRKLNAELGTRLADELQAHFLSRSGEPNKLGADSLGYWKKVADDTVLTSVTETGATVTIANAPFRPRLFGAVIKPTGGRKFLTIPLVKEAYGMRVQEYEQQSGHALFRLGHSRVLVERVAGGDRTAGGPVTTRHRRANVVGEGYSTISIREKSPIRAVFALCPSVTIHKDPRALPPEADLLAALVETGDKWAARQNRKQLS